MKQRHLEIAEECLAIAANHFMLVAAFLTLLGCFGETEPRLELWLLLTIIPYFFYYLRKNSKNFAGFFLLHIIWPFVAIALTVENFTLCTMYFMLTVVYVVWSLKIKLKDKDKKLEAPTTVLAVVVFSVSMIMQYLWGVSTWTNYYMVLVFAYFGCYYLYLYLNKYNQFMLFNKNSTANIPEKEIFTSGFTQTIIYTLGGLGILFVSANIGWFDYLSGIAGSGFMAALRFIISHIHLPDDSGHGQLVEEDFGNDSSGGLPEAVDSPLNDFINDAVLMMLRVFTFVLIIFFIFLIIKLFRTMLKNFMENKLSHELMTAQNEVRESLAVEKSADEEKSRGILGFMDNKEKIRRFYKKRVLKEKSTIVGNLDAESLQRLTAKECCDKISADNLQQIYNRVRYSAEEITADDVRLAKSDRR